MPRGRRATRAHHDDTLTDQIIQPDDSSITENIIEDQDYVPEVSEHVTGNGDESTDVTEDFSEDGSTTTRGRRGRGRQIYRRRKI